MDGNVSLGFLRNSTYLIKKQYLHKLAHLDEELFTEYYSLWITLLVFSTLVSVVGLVANSIAGWVFCFLIKKKTAPVIYTMNLILTDLLLSLSIPARIIMYISKGKCVWCSFAHVFIYFINMYASIFFLTCISIDRYLAIIHPISSKKWRRPAYAIAASVFTWFFTSLVVCTVLTMAIKFASCCYFKLFMLSVFEFFLPLIIITTVTFRMRYALLHNSRSTGSDDKARHAANLLLTVFVIFVVCFTPFHLRQVVLYGHEGVSERTALIAYHVTLTFSTLNCCLDPIVYCFINKNFQQALMKIIRRDQTTAATDTAITELRDGLSTSETEKETAK
uniref:LOW QUALITY PROTEIN: G-protein coupled receptor 20-like n=1 Tax=Myxine glutinosa TaxID=7769 RepID=UPI00358ECD12